jgi:hypothetical protein
MSWLFPTLLCLCLSVVFFLEWRSSRSDQQQAAALFAETVKAVNNRFAFESTQTRSLLKGLGERMDGLSNRLDNLAARPNDAAMMAELPSEAEGSSLPPAPTDGAQALVEEDLPELPPDLNVHATFDSLNLGEFFSNPLFNPNGKELSRAELLKADNLIARARARVMTLRSDIQLLVGEEMDVMREEGLFVDYERGQRMISEPGAYTSAERLDGGVRRLYSFLPDQYPKLHEMRRELKEIPEGTVRRLMALARDQEGG